jgi:hypothetical protein
MKDNKYTIPVFKLSYIDANTVPRRISYSQWSMYEKCPKQWELSYIKKIPTFTYSIDNIFGTAFHETIQHYLTVLYTKSVKEADRMSFREELTQRLKTEYKKAVEANGGVHISTPQQLGEYLEDGIQILEWFQKRRSTYFSTKNMELMAIELELCVQASEHNPSVYWQGFLDLVVRNTETNTIIIYDIKTSRAGWNKYQKADKTKLAQLVAYKTYFSKQYGVPIDNIDVKFFIVKRKLIEESMFPQKRIQEVLPASGSSTRKKVQKQIDAFISECFDLEGNKNETRTYPALSGKGDANCKYCPFKLDFANCPKENRIREYK